MRRPRSGRRRRIGAAKQHPQKYSHTRLSRLRLVSPLRSTRIGRITPSIAASGRWAVSMRNVGPAKTNAGSGRSTAFSAKPLDMRTDGRASTLEDAKIQFAAAWRQWLAWAKLDEIAEPNDQPRKPWRACRDGLHCGFDCLTAFPASASVVLEIPAFQLLIRHTPRTTAATMLSSRRASFRVEPDIKPDIGRIWKSRT
jgi:hypothetical protein